MLPRILLVDDSALIHTLMRMYFADEMVELRSALTAKDAVELADCISPDLILLDADMPGMDGFEVWQQIRKNPATFHMPVIFMTTTTESSKRAHRLGFGAADCIAKPFDAEDLVAKVRAALADISHTQTSALLCRAA